MNPTRLFNPAIVPALILCCASAAPAQDADPAPGAPSDPERRVLIDRDLNAREITLLSITHEAIVYEDDQGRTRQASIGGLVALLPLEQPWGATPENERRQSTDANATEPGVLELADGQRLPGEFAATGGDEDSIVWTHPVFGRVVINLDRVARAVLRQQQQTDPPIPERAPAAGDKDELTLANGDHITGFVVSMGDPIEIEVDGDLVTIAAQRVASVRLANPPKPMQGLVVWLDDGSVVVVAAIDGRDGETVELALPTGQTGVFPVDSLDAVAFRAGRLQGLAAIEPEHQQPVGDRRISDPARILSDPVYQSSSQLRAADIEIPGPMRIEWTLPAGARRFATIAEMPFDAIPWGDCILSVRVDSVEQVRQRISADNPRLEINIPIDTDAHTLIIIVEPGLWGPINDRITLRRPLLLLDNDPS